MSTNQQTGLLTSPPWHMWGGSAVITLESVGPSAPVIPISSTQLAQVNYKRPTVWGFLFSAKLLDVQPAPGAGGIIDLDLEVQLGVGRATIVLPKLISFRFVPNTDPGVQRYATQAVSSERFSGDTTPTFITELTAQSIQATAKAFYVQLPGPFTAKLEVGFHCAPKNHIRPEWFIHEFDGGELGGR